MKSLHAALILAVAIGCLSANPALADNGRGRGYNNHSGEWLYFRNDRDRHSHHNFHDRRHDQNFAFVDGRYGYWHQGSHSNRFGWWFVSNNRWYPYSDRQHDTIVVVRDTPTVIYQPYAFAPPVAAQPTIAEFSGEYCREFQSTIKVGDTIQPAYGTACQQPDNSWKIVR